MNPALTILNELANHANQVNAKRIQEILRRLIIPITRLIEGAEAAQNRKGCLVACFISRPGDRERGDLYTIQFGQVLPVHGFFVHEKIARCDAEDTDVSSASMHTPLESYALIPFHALKGFQFAGCVRVLNPDHSYTYISVSGLNQFADELVSVIFHKMIFGNNVFTGALSDIAREHLTRALQISEDFGNLLVF